MNKTRDLMLERAWECSQILNRTSALAWAEVFVELKMDFWRRFARGLICSSSHGLDYFTNVIRCCSGLMKWEEEGEYGDNFRRIIREREVRRE